MKKSIFTKIGAAAMVLTLVTASLVGGTFAKYTSTAAGTAKATIAKWNVAFNNGNDTFTEGTVITLEGSGKDKKVAPGDKGQFSLSVDASNADVDVDYTITFGVGANNHIKFYSGDDLKDEITDVSGSIDVLNAAEGVSPEFSKTIYWALKDGDNDVVDLKDAVDESVTITMTATQKVPTN